MAGADPVTTLHDSNPATFRRMFPAFADVHRKSGGSGMTDKIAGSGHIPTVGTSTCSDEEALSDDEDALMSVNSVNTVCKEFDSKTWMAPAMTMSDNHTDFVTFMQESDIGMIVRANFDRELGMPPKGYSSSAMELWGFTHANVQIPDTRHHGGVPKPHDVERLLKVSRDFIEQKSGGILFHCKGGFGRSILLASCLVIDVFNVPGGALLGWFRIMRPGVINSRNQELFLKSMEGSAALRAYAGLTPASRSLAVHSNCLRCSVM